MLDRVTEQIHIAGQVHLGKDVGLVGADGLDAERQLGGNVGQARTPYDLTKNLELSV